MDKKTHAVVGRGKNKIEWRKAKLAMAVRSKNAHRKPCKIKAHHWDTIAREAGLGDASTLLAEVAAQVPQVIATVNRERRGRFPQQVADAIFAGIQKTAAQL